MPIFLFLSSLLLLGLIDGLVALVPRTKLPHQFCFALALVFAGFSFAPEVFWGSMSLF
jgi:hypothetical protein